MSIRETREEQSLDNRKGLVKMKGRNIDKAMANDSANSWNVGYGREITSQDILSLVGQSDSHRDCFE